MAVLTGAAGLLLMLTFSLNGLSDGLAVGDLGSRILNLCAVAVLHLGLNYLKVDIRHTGEGELLCFCIVLVNEGGVLLKDTGDSCGDLILVALSRCNNSLLHMSLGELNANVGDDLACAKCIVCSHDYLNPASYEKSDAKK